MDEYVKHVSLSTLAISLKIELDFVFRQFLYVFRRVACPLQRVPDTFSRGAPFGGKKLERRDEPESVYFPVYLANNFEALLCPEPIAGEPDQCRVKDSEDRLSKQAQSGPNSDDEQCDSERQGSDYEDRSAVDSVDPVDFVGVITKSIPILRISAEGSL